MHQTQQKITTSSATAAASMNELYDLLPLPISTRTIPELLLNRAAVSGSKVAFFSERLTTGWVPTTWSDYLSMTEHLAKSLLRAGLRKGDVIGIAIPTCLEWELLSMASWRLGAIVLGIDPAAHAHASSCIIAETNCRVLVINDYTQLASLEIDQANLMFIVGLNNVSGFKDSSIPVLSFDSLFYESEAARDQAIAIPQFPNGDDPAIIIYTSGTTGSSKAIVYSHDQLFLAVNSILTALPFNDSDVSICWLPLSALFQRMVNLIALASGAETFFISEPNTILSHLPKIKPSFLIGVPRFYEKLRQHIEANANLKNWPRRAAFQFALRFVGKNRQKLARWPIGHWLVRLADRLFFQKMREFLGGRVSFVITGSAPMPKKITEWFTGIGLPVLECYGLSENVIPMSMNTLKENRIGSVGRPLKPNLIRISSDGEVIVRSPGVFSGYQNSGDEKGLFTEDGFYRTGDFGSFDQDGFLYLSGRQSDLVKSSTGRKLPLIHIETQYRQIPYLEDIVVIGAGRRCIVALLTINPDRLRRLTGESITAAAEVPIDVRKMISADITLAGKHLATHEQIRGFAVLKKPLSTMGGELTNNGKLRRAFVEENHRALIELIYDYLDRKGTTNIGHGDCFFIGT